MKIGILAGEIPPPQFIHQLVCNIADEDYTIVLYGSLKEENYQYNNSSILLRIKPQDTINVFITSILLIIKYIYINRTPSFRLLVQIWRNERNIGDFIKRCCIVLPPFLDKLDVLHIQWAKTLVYYPEFITNLKCSIILSLRGTHINISPMSDENLASLYRKYFPKVKKFHAVSNSIALEATKYGVEMNKVMVINPAVDEKFLVNKRSHGGTINSDMLNIISVGRCHWIKGYTFALDAMTILKKKAVQFHYTIIASGKDSENICYQIHDLGLDKYVTFVNGLSHDKVIKRLSESNLFLLPSLNEGISNAVLESMALGIPVISTECGGMAELIKNGYNGYLIPVRDADSMASEIEKFHHLTDEIKWNIINNARETIIQNYKLCDQVGSFRSFYSNIVKEL